MLRERRPAPPRSSATRPSCSTTTPRRSAPTTTSATSWSSTRSASRPCSTSTSASSPTAWSSAWAARCRTTWRCACTRPGVRILGTSAGEHRPRRGPPEVQRAARPARHRPAALGARHRRVDGAERSSSSSAASRCWCARATCCRGAAMSVAHEPQRARAHPRRAPSASRPSTRWWSRSSRRTPARSRSTPWPTTASSCSGPSASTSRTPACTAATRRWCCRRRRSTSPRSAACAKIAAAAGARARDHRPVQRAVPGQAQRGAR